MDNPRTYLSASLSGVWRLQSTPPISDWVYLLIPHGGVATRSASYNVSFDIQLNRITSSPMPWPSGDQQPRRSGSLTSSLHLSTDPLHVSRARRVSLCIHLY